MPGVLYRIRTGEVEVWNTMDVSVLSVPTISTAWLDISPADYDTANVLAARGTVTIVSGDAVRAATGSEQATFLNGRALDAIAEARAETKDTIRNSRLFKAVIAFLAEEAFISRDEDGVRARLDELIDTA